MSHRTVAAAAVTTMIVGVSAGAAHAQYPAPSRGHLSVGSASVSARVAPATHPALRIRFTDSVIPKKVGRKAFKSGNFVGTNVDKSLKGKHRVIGFSILEAVPHGKKAVDVYWTFGLDGGDVKIAIPKISDPSKVVTGPIAGGSGVYDGATGTFKVADADKDTAVITLNIDASK